MCLWFPTLKNDITYFCPVTNSLQSHWPLSGLQVLFVGSTTPFELQSHSIQPSKGWKEWVKGIHEVHWGFLVLGGQIHSPEIFNKNQIITPCFEVKEVDFLPGRTIFRYNYMEHIAENRSSRFDIGHIVFQLYATDKGIALHISAHILIR